MSAKKLYSSFRDPSGYLFYNHDGLLLRYVSQSYSAEYDQLMQSGLYQALVDKNLLISHIDKSKEFKKADINRYRIIQPELIKFISYPYEWSFSQLKDAALLTLQVQKIAIKHGMVLKDASAYNIQFHNGKPILIDTLSFDIYEEGKPWVAYRQFCQHFLAPLLLASYVDIRLLNLFRDYIDGVPLDLASSLLPLKTRLKFQTAIHVHLHAKSQKKYASVDVTKKFKEPEVSSRSLNNLITSLESVIKSLKWAPKGTEWGDYYNFTNYSSSSFKTKGALVKKFVTLTSPESVWDMGANTGEFSRLCSDAKIFTVSFDVDPAAVEKNYLQVKSSKETNMLPLILDLTNPSPSIGWANEERNSISERGPVDTLLALALIHHMAISNNLPFDNIAKYFARISHNLIIEFVPKKDSQVKKLLFSRKDIFSDYHEEGFETAFSKYFKITKREPIAGTARTLYLMRSITSTKSSTSILRTKK